MDVLRGIAKTNGRNLTEEDEEKMRKTLVRKNILSAKMQVVDNFF